MSELKITIEQLRNYLGTGLEFQVMDFSESEKLIGINKNELISENDQFVIDYCQPICYRLSDLDKEIEVNGERFVPIDELVRENSEHGYYLHKGTVITAIEEIKWNDSAPFGLYQKLFEWHFWPFDDKYFEQGLVIDKMKI